MTTAGTPVSPALASRRGLPLALAAPAVRLALAAPPAIVPPPLSTPVPTAPPLPSLEAAYALLQATAASGWESIERTRCDMVARARTSPTDAARINAAYHRLSIDRLPRDATR